MLKKILLLTVLCFALPTYAAQKILNIYGWTDEIPKSVLNQFEEETGIKVNLSTYSTNEIMYVKLRASTQNEYDIVMPSGYFADRMRKQGMLKKLDKNKIPNLNNLNPIFRHPQFDPELEYAIPYIWGATGIFYNDQYIKKHEIKSWSDLWNKKYLNQLMLLNDVREVFSIALFALNDNPNANTLMYIKAAYEKLLTLSPNIKLFSTDTVTSIIIDEDAILGMAWNGDVHKATLQNKHIQFIYPDDGFIIWVDNLAILKSAPHPDEAYRFINFILRADIAKEVAENINFAICNAKGQEKLPPAIRNHPILYPNSSILKKGIFQTDLSDHTMQTMEKYWEEFKMHG